MAPWSARARGRNWAPRQTVFVDFTAARCVTCQYNKRNTLADADVLADFAKHGVTLLRADWTRATAPSPPPWLHWAATAYPPMC